MRPEIADKLQGGIRAIPLTGFPAFTTAFSNGVEPGLEWAQLVHALGRKRDVFIDLSTSGNAKNVCFAAEAARAKGLKVVSLTGQHGGTLKTLSDLCISVPARDLPCAGAASAGLPLPCADTGIRVLPGIKLASTT